MTTWKQLGGWVVLTLVAFVMLALTGCERESGISDFTLPRTRAEDVEVLKESLRSTPGGCEVDVTFRALRSIAFVSFNYDFFDIGGHKIRSLSTGVQLAVEAGEVTTMSTEGTTNGPSGVPCSQVARFERIHA